MSRGFKAVAGMAVVVAALSLSYDIPAVADTQGCSRPSGWLKVSASAVTLGDPVTVSWGTTLPSGCSWSVSVSGPGLKSGAPSGSVDLIPASSSSDPGYGHYRLAITPIVRGGSLPLFTTAASVRIDLPEPDGYGRRTIDITQDYQQSDFGRAISVPNADVNLADDLNLDLTGWHDIDIAPGVHIKGGRSSTTPGPRLYTTAIRNDGPETLFRIGEYLPADGVQISGVRIDGGDYGIAGGRWIQDHDPIRPVGIRINRARNVEIANSEISGWSGIGITVMDAYDVGDATNWARVWVHDNYIHHNQRYRHEGYGVQSHDGAHVLIERNVFDHNRHSLESSGAPGTSYRAYNNLILAGGGVNCCWPTVYTHVLDVHGTVDCGSKDAYCGPAGQYFDYRHNTIWYVNGDVLKVRGYPSIGADVTSNVFARQQGSGAISQTDGSNLDAWNNKFSATESYRADVCDFDRDSRDDDFIATGTTWWYKSGATGQYYYLATSPVTAVDEMIFTDVSFPDAFCDIIDPQGVVHVNRRVPGKIATARLVSAPTRSDILAVPTATNRSSTGTAKLWHLRADLSDVLDESVVTLSSHSIYSGRDYDLPGKVLGRGDFNADGAPDLLWESTIGDVSSVYVMLLDDNGQVIIPGTLRREVEATTGSSTASEFRGYVPVGAQFAGIGDFTGDGRSDVLWRDAYSIGQLWMWPAGQEKNKVRMNYRRDAETDKTVAAEWQIQGIGDFNADGYDDIVWRNVHDGPGWGQTVLWHFQGSTMISDLWTGGPDSCHCWKIQQVADFNGDGADDTLWRSNENVLEIWFQGRAEVSRARPSFNGILPDADWHIVGAGDFTADRKADILWRHDNGTAVIWKMNGGSYAGQSPGIALDTAWEVKGELSQPSDRMQLN